MISLCFASFQEFEPIRFPPCFQATSKAPSFGDGEKEQVGENSQGGQSGREQLQSRSGGTLSITDNLPSLQKQEGTEIR